MWIVRRKSDGETFPDFQEKADADTLLKNAVRGGFAELRDLEAQQVSQELWEVEREAWLTRAKADAAAAEEIDQARRRDLADRVRLKLMALGFEKDEIGHLLGGAAVEAISEALK